MANFAVIGSGMSGASCARLLKDQGHEVTVYEEKPRTGGLVGCSIEEGHLFHRVGGHVFNSRDEKVTKWFWSLFDKDAEFLFANRNAAIYLGGKFVGYPIENHLYHLSPELAVRVINELLDISSRDEAKSLGNFRDFLLYNFGASLCEQYFFPYNAKVWNTELSDMPISWLAGKLPMPNFKTILTANVLRSDERDMVHSTFFYPKVGGSQFLIDRILENVIVRHERCDSIDLLNGPLINGRLYDAAIYTGDLTKIAAITSGLEAEFDPGLDFKRNGTTTVLCTCDANPYSWVYIPSPAIKSHRMIMTGNFSPSNNSANLDKGRTTCTIEFVGSCSAIDVSDALAQLPFNPKKIDMNFEPNSYVIQGGQTRAKVEAMRNHLKEHKVWLCGRFAEWEYYNMDAAIASAMNVVSELCVEVANA